jgi:hypothetical protein
MLAIHLFKTYLMAIWNDANDNTYLTKRPIHAIIRCPTATSERCLMFEAFIRKNNFSRNG